MHIDQLIVYYNQTSKHSHYQILASPLRKIIPTANLDVQSRYEQERLDYFLPWVPVRDAVLADIGGNTGFFTFELADRGARKVLYFEGNQAHSTFVAEAVRVLEWEDRITVFPFYLDFENDLSLLSADLGLVLNVLHHAGDDYGSNIRTAIMAKQHIINTLNRLAVHTRFLVFQLGFNWMGDRNRPLFTHGTKKEMIDFITEGVDSYWDIVAIGIAERSKTGIRYQDLNDSNIQRDDSLGEFLNRPLFIMQSRRFNR